MWERAENFVRVVQYISMALLTGFSSALDRNVCLIFVGMQAVISIHVHYLNRTLFIFRQFDRVSSLIKKQNKKHQKTW